MGTYLTCIFEVALERSNDMLSIYRSGAAHLLLNVLSARFRLDDFARGKRESAAQMAKVALASRTRGDFTLLNFDGL